MGGVVGVSDLKQFLEAWTGPEVTNDRIDAGCGAFSQETMAGAARLEHWGYASANPSLSDSAYDEYRLFDVNGRLVGFISRIVYYDMFDASGNPAQGVKHWDGSEAATQMPGLEPHEA
jgi:hypothetical protein